MEKLRTTNHCKHLIQYHLIFVSKYRYKVFSNTQINNGVKAIMDEIATKYDFEILIQEVDKDHIHLLVRSIPDLSPSMIVRVLKQECTWKMYEKFESWMRKFYYGDKRILFTRGYFCSSIGNVSEKTLREYIENQG